LAASEASLLKGCGLDFAHSVKRPQAAEADSLTVRRDKQLEQPRNGGAASGTLAIVKYDQFLAVRAFSIDADSQPAVVEIAGRYVTFDRRLSIPATKTQGVKFSAALFAPMAPSIFSLAPKSSASHGTTRAAPLCWSSRRFPPSATQVRHLSPVVVARTSGCLFPKWGSLFFSAHVRLNCRPGTGLYPSSPPRPARPQLMERQLQKSERILTLIARAATVSVRS